jgi:hypothetical protein
MHQRRQRLAFSDNSRYIKEMRRAIRRRQVGPVILSFKTFSFHGSLCSLSIDPGALAPELPTVPGSLLDLVSVSGSARTSTSLHFLIHQRLGKFIEELRLPIGVEQYWPQLYFVHVPSGTKGLQDGVGSTSCLDFGGDPLHSI